MVGQVFFSYSRKDHEFVHQLSKDLELRGIEVWIDKGAIVAGDTTWRQQIVEGIRSCSVFFIVLSPDSFASSNVDRELTLAERHKKPIIPIFNKCAEIPDSMAYQLAGLQQLDFSLGEYEENFDDLLRALTRLGFSPKDPSEVVEDAEPLPRRKSPESQHPLKKIPVWGWIGGVIILLILLGWGASGILGGSQPEATPTILEAIAIELPTETIVPPTETESPPTETPESTEIIVEAPVLPDETETPIPTEAPTATETSTATEIPSPTPFPALLTDESGVEMVFVTGGEFTMGSNIQEDHAYPAHVVETGDYYIDKYEVTNASFTKCVRDGNCEPPRSIGSRTRPTYYENLDFSFYPVIWVSWDDAVSFCEWRGGRLPSEAEWEKAARGDDRRTYPWGDELGTECVDANFWQYNGCGDTRAIGSTLGESPYGAFEMAGNVWEWVQDDINLFPGGRVGSISSSDFGNKVLRGGSWVDSEESIKTTYRNSAPRDSDGNDVGFRCVMDIPLP